MESKRILRPSGRAAINIEARKSMLQEQNFRTETSVYDRGPRDTPVAPDCNGMNFFDIDRSLISLLDIYLEPALLKHMLPHYREMGRIAGSRLDDLART